MTPPHGPALPGWSSPGFAAHAWGEGTRQRSPAGPATWVGAVVQADIPWLDYAHDRPLHFATVGMTVLRCSGVLSGARPGPAKLGALGVLGMTAGVAALLTEKAHSLCES